MLELKAAESSLLELWWLIISIEKDNFFVLYL